MSELLTMQDLANGHLDVKALGEAANGDENTIVTTRTGNTYPSAERAINIMFQNGGLPATPFATKALMTASALIDGDYAMVTDDTVNNGLYVKTAGAWVKSTYDPVVQAISYADIKIDTLSDDILNTSYNLFDLEFTKSQGIVGLITEDGSLDTDESYYISDYIAINPKKSYVVSGLIGTRGFRYTAYYDKDKVFIARSTTDTTSEPDGSKILNDIPLNAAFLRFSISPTPTISLDDRLLMIHEGSSLLPYQLYTAPTLKDFHLTNNMSSDVISLIESRKDSYDFSDNHLRLSTNLFNPDDTTEGLLVDSSGEVIEYVESRYWLSGYIAVSPDTDYTFNAQDGGPIPHVAEYDINKVFIQRTTISVSGGSKTIKTTANTKYIRVNISGGDPTRFERMINEGSQALPYEKYGAELKNIEFDAGVLNYLYENLEIKPPVSERIITDLPTEGLFQTSKVWNEYQASWQTIQSDDVYAMYDNLMAQHPTYITKHELGNDAWGNAMAYYKCTPVMPDSSFELKRPTVALFLSLHGNEKVPPLATYLMLEQMCNNWESDELLEALRFNVNLIILPICNPSGWNVNSRYNGNDVDLNRSFNITGEPLTEIEAQYVDRVLSDNVNIDAAYDFHNFYADIAGTKYDGRYMYIATSNKNLDVERTHQALISKLTRTWQKRYEWLPQSDWFAGYSLTVDSMTTILKSYLYNVKDIKYSGTFELCETWLKNPSDAKYDALNCRTSMEATTNLLLTTVSELKR